jgi:hypothetical protein
MIDGRESGRNPQDTERVYVPREDTWLVPRVHSGTPAYIPSALSPEWICILSVYLFTEITGTQVSSAIEVSARDGNACRVVLFAGVGFDYFETEPGI